MQVHRFIRLGFALAALALFSTVPGLAQEKKAEPEKVVVPGNTGKIVPENISKALETSVVKCPDRKAVQDALRTIGQSVPKVRPSDGSLPPDCAEVSLPEVKPVTMGFGYTRGWDAEQYLWTAPGLQHKPIYFEDIPLERYGQSKGPLIQPLVSHARFFAVMPTLPYQMSLDPPLRPICTLGYDRPGNCVPYVRHRLPWNTRAAVAQVGTVAGLILLIP